VNMKNIMIIGDIHADYEIINRQIEHYEKETGGVLDCVFQLGDFGFINEPLYDFFITNKNIFLRPVFCLEGNHEDFFHFNNLVKQYKNYFTYLERGSVCTFNEYAFLAFGGCNFMDPINSPPGSVIKRKDIEKTLLLDSENVDIILSHDCPKNCGIIGSHRFEYCGDTGFNGSTELIEHFKPKFFFYSHYHEWNETQLDATKVMGLCLAKDGFVILKENYDVEIYKTTHHKKSKRFFDIFKTF
jgi:Icc-related predicted phosphoesterase